MTGAMLPAGCDCVIPVEKIAIADGVAQLTSDAAPESRANIHARGIDSRRDEELLQPGMRLGPAEVAVIAANGRTHASVTRPPRIVVISTGDELVEPGEPLARLADLSLERLRRHGRAATPRLRATDARSPARRSRDPAHAPALRISRRTTC